MLSIILMSVYGYIGIVIALIVVGIGGYVIISFSKHQKKADEIIAEEQKRKLENPNFSDYDFANESGDYNLYQSSMNSKIKIREVRVFKDRTEEKDKLIFASSMPFEFTGEDKIALIKLIPELIDVFVSNSHELMLLKSPAASFHDDGLHKSILGHLFTYLNRKYAWMKKVHIVSFDYAFGDELRCTLEEPTRNHVRLGILIGNIPEVVDWLDTITQMEKKNAYQFDIKKDPDAEWTDLLPKVQEAFRQYFTGGVEFIGPN